jgi:hypothetical protein
LGEYEHGVTFKPKSRNLLYSPVVEPMTRQRGTLYIFVLGILTFLLVAAAILMPIWNCAMCGNKPGPLICIACKGAGRQNLFQKLETKRLMRSSGGLQNK